jgi:uncharacterized protein YbcI
MTVKSLMTQGEVEAQIGSTVLKFYADMFSRGPHHIQVDVLPSSAVVITQNNFNKSEKQMMELSPQMFRDMRFRIIDSNRAILNSLIESATGVVVNCFHHDVSILTGEEAFIFSLKDSPSYRQNHNGKSRSSKCFA